MAVESSYGYSDLDVEQYLHDKNLNAVSSHALSIVFLVVLMATGLVGNTTVFLVYYKRFRPSSTRTYILAMCVVDLLVNTVVLPKEFFEIRFSYTYYAVGACRFSLSFSVFLVLMSGFVLVSVALDRQRKLCTGRPHCQASQRRVYVSLLVSGVISFAYTVPYVFMVGSQTKTFADSNITGTACSYSDEYLNSTSLLVLKVALLVLFITTASIMVVSNYRIARFLREHKKRKEAAERTAGNPIFQEENPCTHGEITKHHRNDDVQRLDSKQETKTEGRQTRSQKLQTDDLKDPETGDREDPQTDDLKDPETGDREDPQTDDLKDPETSDREDPQTDNLKDPETGDRKDPQTDDLKDPETSDREDPQTDKLKDPETNEAPDPHSVELTSQQQTSPEPQLPGQKANRSDPAQLEDTKRSNTYGLMKDSNENDKSPRKHSPNASQLARKIPSSTTLMLFVLIVAFLVSYLPYLVIQITEVHCPRLQKIIGENLYFIGRRSYLINCAINPIVYNVCSARVRHECLRLFRKCRLH